MKNESWYNPLFYVNIKLECLGSCFARTSHSNKFDSMLPRLFEIDLCSQSNIASEPRSAIDAPKKPKQSFVLP